MRIVCGGGATTAGGFSSTTAVVSQFWSSQGTRINNKTDNNRPEKYFIITIVNISTGHNMSQNFSPMNRKILLDVLNVNLLVIKYE